MPIRAMRSARPILRCKALLPGNPRLGAGSPPPFQPANISAWLDLPARPAARVPTQRWDPRVPGIIGLQGPPAIPAPKGRRGHKASTTCRCSGASRESGAAMASPPAAGHRMLRLTTRMPVDQTVDQSRPTCWRVEATCPLPPFDHWHADCELAGDGELTVLPSWLISDPRGF